MKYDRMDLIARVIAISIFVVLMFIGTAMGEVSREGPVAEWHFDEGAGNVVKDSSGNDNDGIIYGAIWVDGKFGKALYFDGQDDYVEVPDSSSLNPTEQIAIESWYKPLSFMGAGNEPIVDKSYTSHNPPYYQYLLGVTGDGYPNVPASFSFSSSINNQAISTHTGQGFWKIGQWYHIIGIYDSTSVKLYVNGELISSKPASGALNNFGTKLRIGTYVNFNAFLHGTIDEIRIYNRALSPEEVKQHYESGPTALALTKTAAPQSIKQGQTTTITLTVKNTGSTEITDIEVADTIPAELIFVSGESSKNYASLKPGDSRDIQYTLQLNEAGTFNLEPAIATYANDEGNYHTAKSDTTAVAVISSPVASTPTPAPTPTQKDSDGDGWSDEQERTAGTNPNKADTDGDGIWDSKDSNPLVVEETEQKQAVESNVNVENTNTNEDSGIEPLYIGIGAIVILLIGIIAVSSARKDKASAPININIGKVDSPDHIVNDYSTTTNVDNRDGVMQRSNIGTGADVDANAAEKKCSACGTVAEGNENFCNECGGKLY